MSNNPPLAELYISRKLYGEDMEEIGEALREVGFELKHDPLRNQAELVKAEEG